MKASVAPHAGAWIETITEGVTSDGSDVAPHAGAWIETTHTYIAIGNAGGRAPRGRVD